MKPRIAIITTLRHNVGDDFVREGIVHLLRRAIGPFDIDLISKHLPITARRELAWIHSSGISRNLDRLGENFAGRATNRLDRLMPVVSATDKVRRADILVQSGAPVYWTDPRGDCSRTEWWGPLIERRWLPVSRGRTFLNLAGGTCQHYDSDGSEFAGAPSVLEHIRRFYDMTALTTVRDELSLRVLERVQRAGILLPCTSIFAVDRLGVAPRAGEFVALNYMPAGGHFRLGQPIDARAWELRFVALARRVAMRERVVLVCHSTSELLEARRLLPGFRTFHSTDHREYLGFYSRAKWGILNRVHGAFAMASLGKPAAVVGSDSRARMAGVLGLPGVFVNDATEDWLDRTAESLEAQVPSFPAGIGALKASASAEYVDRLRRALGIGSRAEEAALPGALS